MMISQIPRIRSLISFFYFVSSKFIFARVSERRDRSKQSSNLTLTLTPLVECSSNHYQPGNRSKASDNPNTKQVTKRDYAPESEWKNLHWVSQGDSFLNGAYLVESGPKNKKKTALTKNHKIKFKPGSHAGRLTRYAGDYPQQKDFFNPQNKLKKLLLSS